MKHLLGLLFMICLLLSACAYIGATDEILISALPNNMTVSAETEVMAQNGETVVSFSATDDTNFNPQPTVTVYISETDSQLILNTNSKKIHFFESCSYAGKIKAENRQIVSSDSLESLLSSGYSICSWCEKQVKKS